MYLIHGHGLLYRLLCCLSQVVVVVNLPSVIPNVDITFHSTLMIVDEVCAQECEEQERTTMNYELNRMLTNNVTVCILLMNMKSNKD